MEEKKDKKNEKEEQERINKMMTVFALIMAPAY
jgi:hypothetical protein